MKRVGQIVYDGVLILVGAALSAFVMDLILIPNQIAPGGASGLALVINFLIDNYISTGVLIILINIPLFIIGFKAFGKIFVLKTIIGTVAFSVFVDLLAPYARELGDKWLNTAETPYYDLLLFSIYGGVLLGIGLGLVLKAGTSTGGSSLGAQLLNKSIPSVTTGTWLLILDAIVVVLAAFAFKNVIYSLYAIIVIWLSSTLMDIVVEGINHAKAVYIISDKADEIRDELLYKLKRGVTSLAGKGAYSGYEKDVL